jgi:hypothetical protein
MRFSSILFATSFITLVSGCGIQGVHEEIQSAEVTQAASAIEPFKTVSGQSSLGSTDLTFATGSINSDDSNFQYVGEVSYEITKNTPLESNPLAGVVITTEISTATYPVYYSYELSGKTTALVAMVDQATKGKLSKSKADSESVVGLFGSDPVILCDEYRTKPEQVDFAFVARCNLSTTQCSSPTGPKDARYFAAKPDTFDCWGNGRKNDFLHYQKVTKSEVLTSVTVEVNSDESAIQPRISSGKLSKNASAIILSDRQIKFSISP